MTEPPVQVLFACVHNAGRSQMAAAFFNLTAAPDKATATSAGTQPGERVHPVVAEVMRELGIDLSAVVPRRLDQAVAARAQWLITMGCGEHCPVVPGVRREDWAIHDPKDLPPASVRRIRDDIRRRVRELVLREGWTAPG